MKFNKKASMELGISTVVVLVIAMVIIAGGIAFIRGFFKIGTDKLGGAFNVGDFGVQPTSIDPLVLVDGPTIELKTGDRKEVKVGFYNTKNPQYIFIDFGNCVSTVDLPLDCYPTYKIVDNKETDEVTEDAKGPLISSLTSNVEQGQSFGFKTFVTASCEKTKIKPTTPPTTEVVTTKLPSGDYICEIKAKGCGDDIDCKCKKTKTCEPINSAQITLKVNS